jgi:hypothetical protein
MAEIHQTNWADDDDYDSEEAQDEFGLDAAKAQAEHASHEPKVSLFAIGLLNSTMYFC